MNNEQEQRRIFKLALMTLKFTVNFDEDFAFKSYLESYDRIEYLTLKKIQTQAIINPLHLINLVVYEFVYATKNVKAEKQASMLADEKFFNTFCRLVSEKYVSNFQMAPRKKLLMNRYEPPISTLEMQINNILRSYGIFTQRIPSQTVMIDTLKKCFDLIKAVLLLLTRGYETEAFSTWRTLHETECVCLVFAKFGMPVIDAYLKHTTYGVAFRGLIDDKEEADQVFVRLKEEMRQHDLKSKDMKRFIEYGWLYAIPEEARGKEFKINFRNGLEAVAGLSEDAENYEMASEISHSSPLLIYSNPDFFLKVTIIQVYESFFNLEELFNHIYCAVLDDKTREVYLNMRNRNLADLRAIYKIEKKNLALVQTLRDN